MQNCRAALGVAEWWVACLSCLVKAPCSISRIIHTQECYSVVHFRALHPLPVVFPWLLGKIHLVAVTLNLAL